MPTNIAERRRFARFPTSGRVEISFEDPTSVTVEAEMEEKSATGFRIAHKSDDLVPGLELCLHCDGVTKRARVVWTHLLNGRRISGCVLL